MITHDVPTLLAKCGISLIKCLGAPFLFTYSLLTWYHLEISSKSTIDYAKMAGSQMFPTVYLNCSYVI